MISVDHTLGEPVICLRPSTVKFLMPEVVQNIEIFRTPSINLVRTFELTTLLKGLKRYQDEAVQATWKAASFLKEGASLLEWHGLNASYRLPRTHYVLRDLKNHTCIPAPGIWTLLPPNPLVQCVPCSAL